MSRVLEDIKSEEEKTKKMKTSSTSNPEFVKVYDKLKRVVKLRPTFISFSNIYDFLKSLNDLIITHMKDQEWQKIQNGIQYKKELNEDTS